MFHLIINPIWHVVLFKSNSLWKKNKKKKRIGHLLNKTLKLLCVGPSQVTTRVSNYWPGTLIESKGKIPCSGIIAPGPQFSYEDTVPV
jgi:hypothetical protein